MKNDEMISLNEKLYDDFFVNEVENRLETDPLAISGLINLANTTGDQPTPFCWFESSCSTDHHSCVGN